MVTRILFFCKNGYRDKFFYKFDKSSESSINVRSKTILSKVRKRFYEKNKFCSGRRTETVLCSFVLL